MLRPFACIFISILFVSCEKENTDLRELKSVKYFQKSLLEAENAALKTIGATLNILKKNEKQKFGKYDYGNTYSMDEIGVISNHKQSIPSNIYITKGVTVDRKLKNYLKITDFLEDYWVSNKKKYNEAITWQYTYHIASNTIRIYPWINFSELFGPSTQWILVGFFSDKNNYKRYKNQNVCTRPYYDAGDTGLNVSCCRVFDSENPLLTCADVSFKSLFKKLRKGMLHEGRKDIKGVYMSSYALDFAYKKDVVFNFSDGKVMTSNDSKDLIKQYELKEIADYKSLKLKVYLMVK